MRTTKLRMLIFPLACIIGSSAATAQETYFASFLDLHPSVRQIALGGIQVAADGQLESAFNNPAILTSIHMPEAYFSHHPTLLKENHDTAAISFPFKNQALAAAFQYVDAPRFDRTTLGDNGEPLSNGSFHPYAVVGHLSWAMNMASYGSVGLTAKSWQEKIDQKSYNGLAFDVGYITAEVLNSIKWGFSIQNIGENRFGHNLPKTLSIGSRYQIVRHSQPLAQLFGNYSATKESKTINLGLESREFSLIRLRAGYQLPISNDLDRWEHWSLGAAIRLRSWKFDYAWRTAKDLGDEHLFSIHIQMGLTPEEKERMATRLDNEISSRITQKAKYHYLQAVDLMDLKDWNNAVEELNISLAWDPNNTTAKEALSKAIYKKNQTESDSLYQQGLQAERQEAWADATLYYQEALRMDPLNKKLESHLKMAKEKLASTNRSSKSNNTHDQQTYDLGISHYIDGDFTGALIEWKKINNSGRRFPELGEFMAKARANILQEKLLKQTQSKSGKQQIDKLLQNAYTNYSMGNSDEAENLWKRALALDPENEEARWAIDHIHEQKKLDFKDFRRNVDERVNKLNSEAFREYSNGRLQEAIKFWKKALQIDPRDTRIQNNIERVESELLLKESQP